MNGLTRCNLLRLAILVVLTGLSLSWRVTPYTVPDRQESDKRNTAPPQLGDALQEVPDTAINPNEMPGIQAAVTLAAGKFWGHEAQFIGSQAYMGQVK